MYFVILRSSQGICSRAVFADWEVGKVDGVAVVTGDEVVDALASDVGVYAAVEGFPVGVSCNEQAPHSVPEIVDLVIESQL